MRQYFNNYFFNYFKNDLKRLNFFKGGGASGKSHSICQFLAIAKFLQDSGLEILCVRKTFKHLRVTTYKTIIKILNDTVGSGNYSHNKTNNYLTFNNNLIQFMGLDDVENLKSTEWDIIFIEEGTQLTKEDFQILEMRLKRSGTRKPFLLIAFNPIDAFHWLKLEYEDKPDHSYMGFHHSTYKDNRYCNQDTKDRYEKLKDESPTLWQIYAKGLWGVLEDLIYSKYTVIDTFPETFDEIGYGLDFGSTNPSVLLQCCVYDGAYYLKELIYQPFETSSDMADEIDKLEIDKSDMMLGDGSRPDWIKDIRRRGYNIGEADRSAGSVLEGINKVSMSKLFIHVDSLNLIKEIHGYSRKTNRQGQVFDEPVKFNDHAMDAMRYIIIGMDHPNQSKIIL